VAVLRGIPCITTVQGLAAAVEGIEAIQRGGMGVRSLQDHAIDLERLREAERLG
jgi:carbamoyl-phosphate synthase large subunit